MNTDTVPVQDRFDRRSRTEAPASRAPSEPAEIQGHAASDISPESLHDDAFARIRREIHEEYAELHHKPWIIGYSGGKDSTLVAHLVIEHLTSLPRSERTRTVHVVANDTLVESPLVMEHVRLGLAEIERAAHAFDLPVVVATTAPQLNQTFWVNLIGRGYPSPNRTFRWCTDRMKIQPTSTYVREQASISGEVILLLGVRRSESAARAGVAARYDNGSRLNRHNDLQGCLVFRPILELDTDDVWEFLAENKPPWGGSHERLIPALSRRGWRRVPSRNFNSRRTFVRNDILSFRVLDMYGRREGQEPGGIRSFRFRSIHAVAPVPRLARGNPKRSNAPSRAAPKRSRNDHQEGCIRTRSVQHGYQARNSRSPHGASGKVENGLDPRVRDRTNPGALGGRCDRERRAKRRNAAHHGPGRTMMPNGHVVLLRSEAGRRLVRSKCREAGLDPSVLEQLIAVEMDQQGKLRKRGITEAFNEIFDNIETEADE